jgi:Kef-type K+ transport system membrane component KefB
MPDLDILAIIGLVIVTAYLGSKGMARLGIPQVVGFILTGVFLGSSFLDVVPLALAKELGFISEIALGLIGFEIGSHLHFDELRKMGKSIIFILIGEVLGAYFLVGIGVYLLTGSDYTGLVFGSLAVATAPAATVDVLREYKSKGPLTTTLLAVVGLDDALALLLFSISSSIAVTLLSRLGSVAWLQVIKIPLIEIGGALVIGTLIGLPLQWLIDKLRKREHALCAFIVGSVLLTAGLANSIDSSLILATMTVGIVLANYKEDFSSYAHCVIERIGPLIYILFFVLIGARLQISMLPQMGLVGLLYVLLRSVGKYGGSWLGGWLGKAHAAVRDNLGFGLLSQAGVAVGLALSIAGRFDQFGEAGKHLGDSVITVITATTFVVQIIGPILVKYAISHAGEIGLAE